MVKEEEGSNAPPRKGPETRAFPVREKKAWLSLKNHRAAPGNSSFCMKKILDARG